MDRKRIFWSTKILGVLQEASKDTKEFGNQMFFISNNMLSINHSSSSKQVNSKLTHSTNAIPENWSFFCQGQENFHYGFATHQLHFWTVLGETVYLHDHEVLQNWHVHLRNLPERRAHEELGQAMNNYRDHTDSHSKHNAVRHVSDE